ncbi:DUF6058 family natural product biosynthesis protein [Streptomyces sp. NPDC053431]|uniref:DUF6058 family natural product biosynthesis protein n=1 Tax=Streptomyces sp. NPDC053431 TaxID=3365703 RepID=UPI0037CD3685
MRTSTYAAEVARRFREVNGDHPMTVADDAYVSAQFTPLERLCAESGRDVAEARRQMLDGLLPLPGYLRSDGAEMVPRDLFDLAARAGGPERLRAWFVAHWADPAEGAAEWEAYVSGRYVCLHRVAPDTIRRKEELTAAISDAVRSPRPGSPLWAAALHTLVDELDALEPEFAPYDRLRFGGPTSRDTWVDAVRARFPRPAEPSPAAPNRTPVGDGRGGALS